MKIRLTIECRFTPKRVGDRQEHTVNTPYKLVLKTQLNHLANLAKELGVHLQNKWLWVSVQLHSLKL